MQQRYYDPAIGRFLSVDPMASDTNNGWNFNRYNYAANNPYKFTDPDGRVPVSGLLGKIAGAAQRAVVTAAVNLGTGLVESARNVARSYLADNTVSVGVQVSASAAVPLGSKLPASGALPLSGGLNGSAGVAVNNHGQVSVTLAGGPMLGRGGGISGGVAPSVSVANSAAPSAVGVWETSKSLHGELTIQAPEAPMNISLAVDARPGDVAVGVGSARLGVGTMIFAGGGVNGNATYTLNEPLE